MRSWTIHVIDDDDAVRDSLGVMLEVEGFTVKSYSSGTVFLSEAQLGENCCLMIDMHMPGMDGLSLLRRLRGDGPATPAIVMTGQVNDTLRHAVASIGATLLEKPFRLSEVIASIKAATGKDAL